MSGYDCSRRANKTEEIKRGHISGISLIQASDDDDRLYIGVQTPTHASSLALMHSNRIGTDR